MVSLSPFRSVSSHICQYNNADLHGWADGTYVAHKIDDRSYHD